MSALTGLFPEVSGRICTSNVSCISSEIVSGAPGGEFGCRDVYQCSLRGVQVSPFNVMCELNYIRNLSSASPLTYSILQ